MTLPDLSRNPVTALLTGTGTVAAVSALAVTALMVAGLPGAAPENPESATGISSLAQADWKESPATLALTAALSAPPSGWTADGDMQLSATAPLPYSCPVPGAAASTALARSFTAAGHRIRVTTLAFTAGLGAEAVRLQVANTGICAADGAAYTSPLSGPARDARVATTSRGGISTSTVMSRRGDVVTYVTGATGAPLGELAEAMDSVVARRLNGVCVNQDSASSDAARSPFSPAGYRAFTEDMRVEIPKPALPTAAPALKAVPVPAPVLVPETVQPLRQPDYPVHPVMPEPVALPAAPKSPEAAVTAATVAVPAQDTDGPGCGWAFTGMAGPIFDADAAKTTRAALTGEANRGLVAGVRRWQEQTAAYWAEYATYETDAAAYNAYREKVNEVNAAWSVIGRSWSDYREKEADYQAAIKARDSFSTRKAEAAYAKAVEVCSAPEPAAPPAPDPVPSPSATPSAPAEPAKDQPTTTPSPSPTPRPAAKQGCPAQRPDILDQEAPKVPDRPVPPADPRPKQ